jgi:hypothetical protein
MGRDYARAGVEPALEEMLRDPIVRLVMRRDGLEPRDVRCVVVATRRRLSGDRSAGKPSGDCHGSS